MGKALGFLLLLACGNASAVECWKAAQGNQGNVSLLCVGIAGRAEHHFHFSNKGTASSATSCFQVGEAKPSQGRLEVSLEDGFCENKREIDAMRMDCAVDGERSMVCRFRSEEWRYERVFP